MKRRWKPPMKGEVKVKPGKRVIWLARPSTLSVSLTFIAFGAVVMGLIAAGVPVVPLVWYNLKPSTTSRLAQLLKRPVATQTGMAVKPVDTWQPPKDTALPQGGWLKISAIGVNTEIIEAPSSEYEKALRQGVWRVPELGTPLQRTSPTILAGHRFGYLKWSNQYRRLHSFYNLPKLKVNDQIDIYWGQRHYAYTVYAADEGTEISDYSADLILYTCQYLESDRRIFRYARLMKK